MKKLFLAVLVILAMMFSASFTFAEYGDINIGINNDTRATGIGIGGEAQQDQNQDQKQNQNQTACGGAGGKGGEGGQGGAGGHGGNVGDTTATGGSVGNTTADADAIAKVGNTTATGGKSDVKVGNTTAGDVTNQNIYTSPKNKRNHNGAQPGPSGSFVNAPMTPPSKDWELFTCQPFFKTFTYSELELMADEAGGFFSSGISIGVRVEKLDTIDKSNITRLDFNPAGPNDRFIGEFMYESDKPIVWSAVLGHVLLEAKKYGAKRFIVYKKVRNKNINSGLSIGSGVGGSVLGGKDGDAVNKNIALGGLIGWTGADTEEILGALVYGFNDGPTNPPPGVEVCGLKVSAPTSEEIVEEEILPQEPECDPQPIISKIRQLEEGTKNCPNDCLNNELLRKQLGDAYLDLFYCVGNQEALVKAIAEYEKAERNFLEGREPNGTRTSTLQGAQEILYKAHYNSALAIRELRGRDAEISFAQFKKLSERGDNTMPDNRNDIKR